MFQLANLAKGAKMAVMSEDAHQTDRSCHKVPGVFDWEVVRTALQAAEEGVYCWDIVNDRIYYTEQCLRMMGCCVSEIAPNIFTESVGTIHDEDCAFFRNTVQKYLNNPAISPLRVEVRLLNQRTRGWKWIRVNGLLQRGADKKPVRLVGVWVDITRRKMGDLHAMEDRDLFRTLINYLPDNIYFKNRESRFVLANDATARKMGVPTPSDLIGCRDTNFFSDDTTNVARREELEIMSSGIPITNRIHREHWKDGQSSWCRLSKFPWYASNGDIKGIVGISSDVTEMVETQNRLQTLAQSLDRRNRALEKELTLARQVQQALQPEKIPPRTWCSADGSVERRAIFHHIYRQSVGVSGDCFHIFPVGRAGVGMLLCDVMGHDVRAALIASVLRGLMEQVGNLADTPALLLSALNRHLCAIFSKAGITMFATACFLYIDLEKRRVTLSSAGHPAPIVLPRSGSAFTPLLPRSPALGLMENATYRDYELRPEESMKIMLYTDGLTEASRSDGEEFGAERVLACLNESSCDNVRNMLECALTGMRKFIGSEDSDDDLCLLGVELE